MFAWLFGSMRSIGAFFKPKIAPIMPFCEAMITTFSLYKVLLIVTALLGLRIFPTQIALPLIATFSVIYGCVWFYNSTAKPVVTTDRLEEIEKKITEKVTAEVTATVQVLMAQSNASSDSSRSLPESSPPGSPHRFMANTHRTP